MSTSPRRLRLDSWKGELPSYVDVGIFQAMFNACLSMDVNLAVECGGDPGEPYQHVVDLVPGTPVVGDAIFRDVSWVGSIPRATVPSSLHLLALQFKPNLSG